MFNFEDSPIHTTHRRLLARVFTPRRVAELEPKIREFCARSLDAVVGSGRFDFIADLGAQEPMRTIGMLLGIPEANQESHRHDMEQTLRTETGTPMDPQEGFASGEAFAEYIDWRAEHPSDDLMTDLFNAEFEDETGTVRHLTRAEVLTCTSLIAGGAGETTGHLISWTGKVLADHPDQRRELVEDPSLIPAAIKEVLRYEPPGHQFARYVNKDVELLGQTVPEGSVILFLMASANRDDRRYPDGDRFDIHRKGAKHLSALPEMECRYGWRISAPGGRVGELRRAPVGRGCRCLRRIRAYRGALCLTLLRLLLLLLPTRSSAPWSWG